MKIFSIFALIVFSMSTMAYVPNLDPIAGQWYPIYSCDNGSMVIDRAVTGTAGRYKSYSTQLVIRNKDIVDWFKSNNATYSNAANSNEVIFGDLNPRFENELFHSDEYLTQEVNISESNGKTTVYLNVYGSGRANWYFRDCQKLEATNLF